MPAGGGGGDILRDLPLQEQSGASGSQFLQPLFEDTRPPTCSSYGPACRVGLTLHSGSASLCPGRCGVGPSGELWEGSSSVRFGLRIPAALGRAASKGC